MKPTSSSASKIPIGKKIAKRDRIVRTLVLGIVFLVLLLLIVTTIYTGIKNPHNSSIGIIAPFLFMAAACVVVYFILPYIKITDKTKKIILLASIIFAAVLGLIYLCLINGNVEYHVDTRSIMDAIEHPSWAGYYLQMFPHQSIIATLLKIIWKMFGTNNNLPFYLINLSMILLIVFCIYKISDRVFRKNEITVISTVLVATFSPLIFDIALIYGDLLGLAFTLLGTLLFITNRRDWRYILGAALCLAVAVIFKNSLVIVPLAFIAYGVIAAIISKKTKGLLSCLLIVIPCLIAQPMLKLFNLIPTSDCTVPTTAWIAMGLQSGQYADSSDLDYVTSVKQIDDLTEPPGSYNGYIWGASDHCKISTETIKDQSSESIKKSASSFIGDPAYAVQFFSGKISSIWADPSFYTNTYASPDGTVKTDTWITYNREHAPRGLNSVTLDEAWTRKTIRFFQVAQQLFIYVFAAIGVFILIRNKKQNTDDSTLLLAIIFLGGFAVYLLWEAASRYAIPYYLLLMPFAAYGFVNLAHQIKQKISSRPKTTSK